MMAVQFVEGLLLLLAAVTILSMVEVNIRK